MGDPFQECPYHWRPLATKVSQPRRLTTFPRLTAPIYSEMIDRLNVFVRWPPDPLPSDRDPLGMAFPPRPALVGMSATAAAGARLLATCHGSFSAFLSVSTT